MVGCGVGPLVMSSQLLVSLLAAGQPVWKHLYYCRVAF